MRKQAEKKRKWVENVDRTRKNVKTDRKHVKMFRKKRGNGQKNLETGRKIDRPNNFEKRTEEIFVACFLKWKKKKLDASRN